MRPSCLQTVVTGMGLVLPCGDGIDAARGSRDSRQPCFAELPGSLGGGRGAACRDFKSSGIIPSMASRRLDRPSRFAWVAADQAFRDAGLDPKAMGERIGVAVGTCTGGDESTEAFLRPTFLDGPEGASPMVFPNCVSVALSGHLSTAFGLKGPGVTQLGREASVLMALEQAALWLHRDLAEAVLLVGSDGLFPILQELLARCRLSARRGLPEAGSRRGMLPGEGAQAFVLETPERARSRGAKVRAHIRGYSNFAPASLDRATKAVALRTAAEELVTQPLDAWIGGSSGHPILDDAEAPLRAAHPEWPAPRFPKLLWGEFCGSGGQLLAAAMLEKGRHVLITAPASFGPQHAMLIENAEAQGG